jgi:uncharacterized protein RhaS with RHS repeats
MGIDGGLNLYAYASGNPLAYIDPLGLCAMTSLGGFFEMIGGGIEAAVGYAAAFALSASGVGIAAGVAVGMHGTDVAIAGYNTMMSGERYDTLTSQGLQAVGVPQDWANGIDAGISMAGTMGAGAATRGVKINYTGKVISKTEPVPRVRHHTSVENLRKIRESQEIWPARGDPIGVHVETQPFGPVSSASSDVGAFGRGAYIEFDRPQTIVPTYIGPRNTGVIPTQKPFIIDNLNPVYWK